MVLLLKFDVNEIAVVRQLTDEGIDLTQGELWAAFQKAADKAVFVDPQLQGCSAGILNGSNAEFLGEGEHSKDAADADFALLAMEGVAERTDLGSRARGSRQQLHGGDGNFLRTIAAMKTMAASLLPDMLADKLMGFGIDNADMKRIPLNIHLRSNPGRRTWRDTV